MSPIVLPLIQLAQKIIPMAFNDNPETKFDLSAALNLALIALLVYLFGFDNAEGIIELSKDMQ
ncbi:TMhelix containing protein [Vibrio phage 1.181.O._10N.286.46.C9]|nr:TMhelix containing protein [Vibrio phage 1.181.O._10N.286.46.C9]